VKLLKTVCIKVKLKLKETGKWIKLLGLISKVKSFTEKCIKGILKKLVRVSLLKGIY
jgi:hypothetical protein